MEWMDLLGSLKNYGFKQGTVGKAVAERLPAVLSVTGSIPAWTKYLYGRHMGVLGEDLCICHYKCS